MKKQIKLIVWSAFIFVLLFTACKKDVALPKVKDKKKETVNTAMLASKIENDVNDFKRKYLKKKSNITGNGASMGVNEAIEMIETDLNYTYAETWVAEGIVNTPFKHSFAVSIPSNGEFDGEDIYNTYHSALNAIIETNNDLTQPDKKLTWVDLELVIDDDGANEVIVNYLFAFAGIAYHGPGPLQVFNYSGYWHWNNGGVSNALGYFNNHGSTSPVIGQYGGAAGQINGAAQNNFNHYQWFHNLTGYYVGNTFYDDINYVASPHYANTQIAQWRSLAYIPGLVNQFAIDANNNSPAANVYPEASYRAEFFEPTATAPEQNVPNGYWWNFDRECLPDYALNFYTARFVDFAKDIMPTTGILAPGDEVYSFTVGGLHTHTTVIVSPSTDNVTLNHIIDLNVGSFIGHTRVNLPASLPLTPTLVP